MTIHGEEEGGGGYVPLCVAVLSWYRMGREAASGRHVVVKTVLRRIDGRPTMPERVSAARFRQPDFWEMALSVSAFGGCVHRSGAAVKFLLFVHERSLAGCSPCHDSALALIVGCIYLRCNPSAFWTPSPT